MQTSKKNIKLKCCNGITYKNAITNILFELNDIFNFIESEDPDFILFGPYGNDLPLKGDYVRIGYFCENIQPDLSICEWAFGVPREEEICNAKYKRIQWHGLNSEALIKNLDDNEIDRIISSKTKFCNFLYSHPVPYREKFFKQLNKYKRVDAPGRSMNNMNSIDSKYTGNVWERKRKFLMDYKFTIAFENYSYPGYQTEKLYDAMLVNSLPLYFGDIHIDEIFNTKSFVNASDFIKVNNSPLIKILERASQQNFKDYRPRFYKNPYNRAIRMLKANARRLKMSIQSNKLDFTPLVDLIIEIDRDKDFYIKYLKEPWFVNNVVPIHTSLKDRWTEIFNSKILDER